MQKRDQYAECNVDGAPEHIFTESCCKRCHSRECTRALYGASTFDDRVTNWLERMFTQVPRMSINDPRYPTLSRQGFMTIETGPVPSISSGWVDPRALTEPEPAPLAVSASAFVPMRPPVPSDDGGSEGGGAAPLPQAAMVPPGFPVPAETVATSTAVDTPPSPPKPLPVAPTGPGTPPAPSTVKASPTRLNVLNSPSQSGRMLGGATAAPPPKADPWSASPPRATPEGQTTEGGGKVVQRGARIKLGK
jgi:hypothetical protein